METSISNNENNKEFNILIHFMILCFIVSRLFYVYGLNKSFKIILGTQTYQRLNDPLRGGPVYLTCDAIFSFCTLVWAYVPLALQSAWWGSGGIVTVLLIAGERLLGWGMGERCLLHYWRAHLKTEETHENKSLLVTFGKVSSKSIVVILFRIWWTYFNRYYEANHSLALFKNKIKRNAAF